ALLGTGRDLCIAAGQWHPKGRAQAPHLRSAAAYKSGLDARRSQHHLLLEPRRQSEPVEDCDVWRATTTTDDRGRGRSRSCGFVEALWSPGTIQTPAPASP